METVCVCVRACQLLQLSGDMQSRITGIRTTPTVVTCTPTTFTSCLATCLAGCKHQIKYSIWFSIITLDMFLLYIKRHGQMDEQMAGQWMNELVPQIKCHDAPRASRWFCNLKRVILLLILNEEQTYSNREKYKPTLAYQWQMSAGMSVKSCIVVSWVLFTVYCLFTV